MHATFAVDAIKRSKSPYLYMRPGTGKSFVILLTFVMLRLEKGTSMKVAITTFNKMLLEQLEEFSTGFNIGANVEFRLPKDFDERINWDCVFVDETFHQLIESKIAYGRDGHLTGIFKMGKVGKTRCYLGGDYTADLEPILKLIDPKVVFYKDWPSLFDMINLTAYNPMKVICREPMDMLKDEIIR